MGEYDDMKKLTYVPIIGIAIGEILIFDNKIVAGAGIHIMSLLAIILIIIFGSLSLKTKNILQSLILLPIMRIISLSISQLSNNINVQLLIIYGIMIVPIYLIMRHQYMIHKESGTSTSILLYNSSASKRVYIYEPITILMIIVIAMIGQYIGTIPYIHASSSDVTVIGEFVSIFLVIVLSISLLVSDTKYCNKYISETINIYSGPLLLVFATIVINKIMVMM